MLSLILFIKGMFSPYVFRCFFVLFFGLFLWRIGCGRAVCCQEEIDCESWTWQAELYHSFCLPVTVMFSQMRWWTHTAGAPFILFSLAPQIFWVCHWSDWWFVALTIPGHDKGILTSNCRDSLHFFSMDVHAPQRVNLKSLSPHLTPAVIPKSLQQIPVNFVEDTHMDFTRYFII